MGGIIVPSYVASFPVSAHRYTRRGVASCISNFMSILGGNDLSVEKKLQHVSRTPRIVNANVIVPKQFILLGSEGDAHIRIVYRVNVLREGRRLAVFYTLNLSFYWREIT